MCGRFAQRKPSKVIAETFKVDVPELLPRHNIAPTQHVLAVRESREGREAVTLRWGLVPSWSKEMPKGAGHFNARGETVAEKPSFRDSFRHRRCLIPADGFYEWQKLRGGKQPHFFYMKQEEPFAFAGLWDSWRDAAGDEIESCTILTTSPNELLSAYHDRMPVIIVPQGYDLWLDSAARRPELLRPLLRPYPAEEMSSHPVRTLVNTPADDSRCAEPRA